jgi:hypothetical protein
MEKSMRRNLLLYCYFPLILIACVGTSNPIDFQDANIHSLDVSVINYDPSTEGKFVNAVVSHLREKGYHVAIGKNANKTYNLATSFYKDIKSYSKANSTIILDITVSEKHILGHAYNEKAITGAKMMYWVFDNRTEKPILRADALKGGNFTTRYLELISIDKLQELFPMEERKGNFQEHSSTFHLVIDKTGQRISLDKLEALSPTGQLVLGKEIWIVIEDENDFVLRLVNKIFTNFPTAN